MKHKTYLDNDPEFMKMKKVVIDTYDSPSWRFRVSKMKQSQIIAIYFSIISRKNKQKEKRKKDAEYHQVTLFEYCPAILDIDI